jgi:predicted deacylase
MVNILAYRAGTRAAPQDGLDLNRSYPGKPLEQAMHVFAHTEIAVYAFFNELKRVSNYLVDCHAGGWYTTMSPYAQYFSGEADIEDVSLAMAKASGMTLIWRTDAAEAKAKAPNSLKIWAYKEGIPGITLEMGGQGRLDEVDVARTHQSLLNIMMQLEILDGEPVIPGPQYYVKRGNWLRPESGGVLWCKAKPLDRVKEGQVIHIITDLLGREREKLLAPVDGVVVGIRTLGMVNSGEYCGNIGEIEE